MVDICTYSDGSRGNPCPLALLLANSHVALGSPCWISANLMPCFLSKRIRRSDAEDAEKFVDQTLHADHTFAAQIKLGIDDSYDWTRSTEENHALRSVSGYVHIGEFANHRATLDYTYHRHYTHSRQLLQDSIVNRKLKTVVQDSSTLMFCPRPLEPWIVFTGGAMGAGKSRFMNWAADQGYFPLESFVQVDPDAIRYELPEMDGYLARDRTSAGSLTQKESGLIQELLTLEGLQQGKNVLVDGSLRDFEWYASFIARMRREFKQYRIGIIHVVAEPAAVLQRAARRADATGRVVPTEKILNALEEVPRSVQKLSAVADYTTRINTDGPIPLLETDGETWETFTSRWQQQCMVSESVPSLNLLPLSCL